MDRLDIEKSLKGLSSGDDSILEAIYRQNRIPFLNFAKKYDLPDDDLIDIYQDAIIALHDNVVNGKFKHINSTLSTYLFSIGKFMIFKKLKANKKTDMLFDGITGQSHDLEDLEFYEGNPATDQQVVNASFEKLGDRCQQVLKLFYYDGLTLKEIQHYFNYDNYNVVKSQKSRCLKTLKDMINKQKQNG
jgi:RNA polymerase sigma factor (sigma-70 family)